MTRAYGIVPDARAALDAAARQAVRECDAVVISAGSSVSTRDLTADVIGSLGSPGILAHGLALKPGKPSIVALAGTTPVFGLPGNPVSALVCVRPAGGAYDPAAARAAACRPARTLRALLSRNLASVTGRVDFIPAASSSATTDVAEPISSLIFTLRRRTR